MPRDVIVPRYAALIALALVTLAIIAITVWMAGRSYENFDPIPFSDLKHLVRRLAARPISTQLLAVIVMPVIANVLLFVPWGMLMFISLYTTERPTLQTYVLTILLGFSFSLGIEGWQYFLPSRVADINDVIWNTAGTVVGAFIGHARLRVRFEFE
ncbi:MAG TPA: VanZ family protein [Thermoanaerobaculia bacterium]|nr:VanZ family protein [Thermoanaerobaculia bacterium]